MALLLPGLVAWLVPWLGAFVIVSLEALVLVSELEASVATVEAALGSSSSDDKASLHFLSAVAADFCPMVNSNTRVWVDYPVSYCLGASLCMLSFQKSHICTFAMSHTRSKPYSLMDLC